MDNSLSVFTTDLYLSLEPSATMLVSWLLAPLVLACAAEPGSSLRGAVEALQRRQRGVHARGLVLPVPDYDALYEFIPPGYPGIFKYCSFLSPNVCLFNLSYISLLYFQNLNIQWTLKTSKMSQIQST